MMNDGVTNNIKSLIKLKKMTQKELAIKSGLTESAISHYVKGDRVPRGSNLVKIAKALGTTTDDLLGAEKNKDNLSEIKLLISRNASKMTDEEKMELIKMLMKGD